MILINIFFLWRLFIILHKYFYFLFFLFSLDLQAVDPCCNEEFDVIVLYPSAFYITINKDAISLTLTPEEAKTKLHKPINLFIGDFIVTAYVSSCLEFTVTAYSDPEYVAPTNQFHCICDHDVKTTCTLGVFTNKNAEGVIVNTEITNNQIIIEGTASAELSVYQRKIDAYATYIQYEGDENCICHIPIYFLIAGA